MLGRHKAFFVGALFNAGEDLIGIGLCCIVAVQGFGPALRWNVAGRTVGLDQRLNIVGIRNLRGLCGSCLLRRAAKLECGNKCNEHEQENFLHKSSVVREDNQTLKSGESQFCFLTFINRAAPLTTLRCRFFASDQRTPAVLVIVNLRVPDVKTSTEKRAVLLLFNG